MTSVQAAIFVGGIGAGQAVADVDSGGWPGFFAACCRVFCWPAGLVWRAFGWAGA